MPEEGWINRISRRYRFWGKESSLFLVFTALVVTLMNGIVLVMLVNTGGFDLTVGSLFLGVCLVFLLIGLGILTYPRWSRPSVLASVPFGAIAASICIWFSSVLGLTSIVEQPEFPGYLPTPFLVARNLSTLYSQFLLSFLLMILPLSILLFLTGKSYSNFRQGPTKPRLTLDKLGILSIIIGILISLALLIESSSNSPLGYLALVLVSLILPLYLLVKMQNLLTGKSLLFRLVYIGGFIIAFGAINIETGMLVLSITGESNLLVITCLLAATAYLSYGFWTVYRPIRGSTQTYSPPFPSQKQVPIQPPYRYTTAPRPKKPQTPKPVSNPLPKTKSKYIPTTPGPSMKSVQWPTIQDYVGAFQNMNAHLRIPNLKNCTVEPNNFGLPRAISGQFACVFRVHRGNSYYALRCFYNSKIVDLQSRYSQISKYLLSHRFPFFVDFTYFSNGICVGGKNYPVLEMEWAKGELLDKFIERNLGDKMLLEAVAKEILRLVDQMQRNGIAHGDLQHGNMKIHLDPQHNSYNIFLLDYDGLYIPAFSGLKSPELGNRNYQHPKRNASHYDFRLDNFSTLVIYLSLLALAENPKLWQKYHDDETLIFCKNDFEEPKSSRLIQDLLQSNSRRTKSLTWLLTDALNYNPLDTRTCPSSIMRIS